MPKPLRIFASAYACRPGSGSEEGSGWNIVMQLARLGHVVVVTLPEHRSTIEMYWSEHTLPNVEFHYLDIPRFPSTHALVRKGAIGRFPHYLTWQILVWRMARRLHRQQPFDVTHHVTYAQYWTGSWLPLLGVPFVWGPVGGGESAPRSFWSALDSSTRTYERKRVIARAILSRYPAARLAAKRSAIALAATEETAEHIRHSGGRDVRLLATTALPVDEYERLKALGTAPRRPFNVLSVSRLEGWKALHLGLDAFKLLLEKVPDATYWIVGTGPDEDRLRHYADQLGIGNRVLFLGRRPRDEVFVRMQRSQVFLHPSLHDSGGWAVTEAMAAGLAVVCLKLGGPGAQVTPGAGFAIPAHNPEQATRDLADAMIRIAEDYDLRREITIGARARAGEFLWERVGDRFAEFEPYQPRSIHS